MAYRLGVDIGGTFTDLVLLDEASGAVQLAKISSTPRDPSISFLDVVARGLRDSAYEPEACVHLVHGTTVATNTIIEGKGATTALITTAGFRDIFEIGRQIRPRLYDLFVDKPPPLIPRRLCFEVPERLDASGRVLTPLDERAVLDMVPHLRSAGVESVVICFLHAYINSAHEQRVAELLGAALPDLAITTSAAICSEMREYFRASTAAVNALLVPVVGRYLARLSAGIASQGLSAELHLMTSSGGLIAAPTAQHQPVYLVESGPAAGVTAAAYIGKRAGFPDVISFDMGGTTAKLGLVEEGAPRVAHHFEVGSAARATEHGDGYPVRTPVVDLVEIGAGGGSVAWIDEGGALRVGPRSGGADPGPVCYGLGQTEPCVTDANLVLGRINPDYFIGGEATLRLDLAEAAIDRLAADLGVERLAAAHGIVEIANANMVGAARAVSVQRGFDPRSFTLVAFGGAGPLHAAALAAELKIPRVLVPPSPGVASALGLLVGDIRHNLSQTWLVRTEEVDLDRFDALCREFVDQGRRMLVAEHVAADAMRFRLQVEMRFCGQAHELTIDVPERDGHTPDAWRAELARRLSREHERVYGFSDPDEPSEIVAVGVVALGAIRPPAAPDWPRAEGPVEEAIKATRPVFFADGEGVRDCPIFDRPLLRPGHLVVGPAVVEEYDATTLIPPGVPSEIDATGHLIMDLGA